MRRTCVCLSSIRIYVLFQIRCPFDRTVLGLDVKLLCQTIWESARTHPHWALGNIGTILFAIVKVFTVTMRRGIDIMC